MKKRSGLLRSVTNILGVRPRCRPTILQPHLAVAVLYRAVILGLLLDDDALGDVLAQQTVCAVYAHSGKRE